MRRATTKRGRIALGTGGALVLVVASVAALGARSGESSPSSEAERVAPAGSESELTGFGASDAAWNAHHREDRRFAADSAYDPDPTLARGGDRRFNDRYYTVGHESGRVLNYEMRFPPGTSVQEAKRSVLASEFPSDAEITWFKRLDSCAQMIVRSKKVARELEAQVAALVEFSSSKWGDRYDPKDVWSAIVLPIHSALSCARSEGEARARLDASVPGAAAGLRGSLGRLNTSS